MGLIITIGTLAAIMPFAFIMVVVLQHTKNTVISDMVVWEKLSDSIVNIITIATGLLIIGILITIAFH